MSELKGIWNSLVIGIVSIFLGLLALRSGPVFNPIFVAIIVAIVWVYTSKVDRLAKKLSQIEAGLSADQSSGTKEHPNASSSS